MSEVAARKRVRRALDVNRIVFVRVGANVGEDRSIDAYIERDGAMVLNPEYAAIVRDIVRAARPRR